MSGKLLGSWEPGIRTDFALADTSHIGSDERMDVRIVAPGVMPAHATIVREADGVWLVDDVRDVKRGTCLNGSRVVRERLQHLDVISIGSVDLIYVER